MPVLGGIRKGIEHQQPADTIQGCIGFRVVVVVVVLLLLLLLQLHLH